MESPKATPDFSSKETRSGRVTGGIALWAVLAAFGTYFCVYAFRKPFTAAAYSDQTVWGLGYKSILISAQVIGYTLSKFIGIKVIAEMQPHRRAATILGLIGFAELMLVFFGLTPAPYNFIFLFANGLPLGMTFGLVLGFLEGRRLTEALTAGLCASFIVADGAAKSVGAWLLSRGIAQYWMPAAAGLLFFPPLVLFVWMLTRIPQPDEEDADARAERVPLLRRERREVLSNFAGGLIPIIIVFTLVTILRSIRADFAPEIWLNLGEAPDAGVFARSEVWVAAGVLLINGGSVFIQNNRMAFLSSLAISMSGLVLITGTLIAFKLGLVRGFAFMVLTGLGLYLPYVAVHTTVFERLIAMTRIRANLGFLMYTADAFGYLGYVIVMIGRGLIDPGNSFLNYFQVLSWGVAGLGVLCLLLTWRHFGLARFRGNLTYAVHNET